ncbi:helix-turn-helix domain-containing protein [Sphingomonas panni]|uniref:helix-turn-helix domain-containing protein n=1 Tax=Sphingomonas panni TaxID=237612 RepID=UPI001F5B83F5|nr:helix-turn-helix domain-containing protein [Sphingomonas panni]
MDLASLHPEDVKAAIRKKFGAVAKFERAKGLPEKSVNDVLRGRSSARVKLAIEQFISQPLVQSEDSASSIDISGTHRLNAKGQ